MYRTLSLFSILSLSLLTFACGSDAAEAEENSKGITVTYENDEGEKESVNVDLDNLDIDLSEASEKFEEAIENMNLEENGEDLEEALNSMAKALNESFNDGEKVETMNFRDIKATLPSRLLGMDRTEFSGEKNGAFGFSVAQAEATYEEDDERIEVAIVDGGNMGIAKMGVAAWASVEIDKESDEGYERTVKIDGHKAFEKYEERRGVAELVWLYKDRYIISLKGKGVDGDDLRRALKRIDYDDLD